MAESDGLVPQLVTDQRGGGEDAGNDMPGTLRQDPPTDGA